MKKGLLVFLISFALSIALTIVPLFARASLSVWYESNYLANLPIYTLINMGYSLAGLAVVFLVFYFLANTSKIRFIKSTVLAILLGVMLGPAIISLLNVFLYPSYTVIYVSSAVGSAVSAIFGFFLPALTAVLFVELKEKRSNNNHEKDLLPNSASGNLMLKED